MASRFERSVHVRATAEAVWAHLTDWPNAPQWMAGIESLETRGDGDPGIGTYLDFSARGAMRTSEIVAWSPPNRLVLRSQQGGIVADYEYSCAPEHNGTRLTLRAQCQARSVWRLAAPLIGVMMARTDGGQVAALKQLVEATEY